MNESISRAAGTQHGQEMPPAEMDGLIRASGRAPQQRTTLYKPVHPERFAASYDAAPWAEIVQTPLRAKRSAPAAAPLPVCRTSGAQRIDNGRTPP